eukprot:m.170404 g.170404  ORF g.170404 m.170404 type:complete len:1176 (+) comp9926_c0_seq2:488-4015(+)
MVSRPGNWSLALLVPLDARRRQHGTAPHQRRTLGTLGRQSGRPTGAAQLGAWATESLGRRRSGSGSAASRGMGMMTALSRRAVPPGAPPLPAGCSYAYDASNPNADDDDATSESLAWPLALHCPTAGLTAVPPLAPQLLYIHLGTNNISALAPDAFAAITEAVHLSLAENSISALPSKLFENATALQRLYLELNAITILPGNVFGNLTALVQLTLNQNKITSLPDNLFDGLPNLLTLSLDENAITVLPAAIFRRLTKLLLLDLYANALTALPDGVFTSLTALTMLDLQQNAISELSASVFQNLTSLIALYIDNNALTAMPGAVFGSLAALKNLSFAQNAITSLPDTLFANLSAIQGLLLSQNKITQLPGIVFHSVPSLMGLALDQNLVQTLPTEVFGRLTALIFLTLSHNLITTLPADIFTNCTALVNLDVSQNFLTSLDPATFRSLTVLQTLYLSQNFITDLPRGIFAALSRLRALSLAVNRITQIAAGTLSLLPAHMLILDVSTNAVTAIDPDMHGRWNLTAMLYMSDNPSSCGIFYPTVPQALDCSNATQVQCTCATGFIGTDFCLPIEGAVARVPAHISWASTLNVSGAFFPGYDRTASVEIVGRNYLFSAIIPQGSWIFGGSCEYSLLNNQPALVPLGRTMIVWVLSVFSVVGDENTIEACCYTNYCAGEIFAYQPPVLITQQLFLDGAGLSVTITAPANPSIAPVVSFSMAGSPAGLSLLPDEVQPDTAVLVGSTTALGVHRFNISATETITQETMIVAVVMVTVTACSGGTNPNSSLCSYHGTCTDSVSVAAGYTCSCHPGYSGPSCHTAISSSSATVPVKVYLPAILVGLAVVGMVALIWFRRTHHRQNELHTRLLETEHQAAASRLQLDELRKTWEIASEDFALLNEVGRGAFGVVYRGRWRDMDVAVKSLMESHLSEEELRQELDREASMLQAVRHAHIVQFLGAGTLADGSPFIVTEFMDRGCLTAVLQTHALDWPTKQRFAHEIALGMALVHSLGRMHRDLKSGNVLVTAAGGTLRVKVADFGTATLLDMARGAGLIGAPVAAAHASASLQPRVRTKGLGTPLWMAPEVLAGEDYTYSADVYSYAIVMWEIAAQAEPWPDVQGAFVGDQLLRLLRAGTRLPAERGWPGQYVQAMQAAWALRSEDRPTFAQLCAALQDTRASQV